jgi:glycosyltransferase involved in cell wall biosynthesis
MRVLFCGQSQYPNNTDATSNRYASIAQAMSIDNEIIFINRIPLNESNLFIDKSQFKYLNISNQKFRSRNFFKRNSIKLLAPIFEFYAIRKLNKIKKIDWINIYTEHFILCVFYYILSKIFKFKTIYHYVEIRSTFKIRSIFTKLNHLLLDNIAIFLFDRYIPISHSIDQHLKNKNKNAKTLIIPPICDFEYFNNLDCLNTTDDSYFLYCGSSFYTEVIIFIIEAFKKIEHNEGTKLFLVLNVEISIEIKNLIETDKENIKIFTRLDYNELICLYKNALALLIPLRNTKQDEARFPQKICEYVASNKIIISTSFGEVKFYFQDMKNALIANKYDTILYAEKMQWVLSNSLKIKELEENAYVSGRKYFDIRSYYEPIKEFLK